MRTLFFVLSIIFTFLSIVFSFLPLDTLAFLPIGIALIFVLITLKKSDESQKRFPKILLLIASLCTLLVVVKIAFQKNEVAKDTTFEKEKIEAKKEAKKELEEIEDLK